MSKRIIKINWTKQTIHAGNKTVAKMKWINQNHQIWIRAEEQAVEQSSESTTESLSCWLNPGRKGQRPTGKPQEKRCFQQYSPGEGTWVVVPYIFIVVKTRIRPFAVSRVLSQLAWDPDLRLNPHSQENGIYHQQCIFHTFHNNSQMTHRFWISSHSSTSAKSMQIYSFPDITRCCVNIRETVIETLTKLLLLCMLHYVVNQHIALYL